MEFDTQGARSLMGAVCLMAIKDWKRSKKTLETLHTKQARRGPYNVEVRLAQNSMLYLSDTEQKQKLHAEKTIRECEEFFDSPIFTEMTGLSGKTEAIRRLCTMNYRQREALKRSEQKQ